MLLIFGANGEAGRALIQILSTTDDVTTDDVVALLRRPSEDDFFEKYHVQTDIADVLQEEKVNQILMKYQPKIVISFVGGKNEQGIRSDAVGNINIIRATQKTHFNTRFILISSMGCGEQWESMSEICKRVLGEALMAKTEAEVELIQSSLSWTILRPCGLDNSDNQGYMLTLRPSEIPNIYMSRKGLAAAIINVLGDANTVGRIYTIGAK